MHKIWDNTNQNILRFLQKLHNCKGDTLSEWWAVFMQRPHGEVSSK